MKLANWSIIIAVVLVVTMAALTYQRAAAQAGEETTNRVLGFDILTSEEGDRFFAILAADSTGALRVDVYDAKGKLSGSVGLYQEPESSAAPVRILPE